MNRDIRARLAAGEWLVFDGGISITLTRAGFQPGEAAELWNVEHPEAVRDVHRDYLEAGAQLLTTNSFQGSSLRLAERGLGGRTTELNRAAAALAREVAGDQALVGGSMGPCGQFLQPLGTLSYEEAVESFAEQAAALVEGGADFLLVETMSDLAEARAAVEGAQRTGWPVVATMTFDLQGRTMMGLRAADAVQELAALGVVAVGANCGDGPEVIRVALEAMHRALPDFPLVGRPNAGLPELVADRPVYRLSPEDLAAYVPIYLDSGARIVGSCCGSTPDHTRAIVARVREWLARR